MICSFSYYGGKYRLVNIIRALMPSEYDSYYELCAGSAVVALNMPRCRVEVVNDYDPDIANIHYVMTDKDKGDIFIERIWNLEYTEEVFDKAKNAISKNFTYLGDIERAVSKFIVITFSFNATQTTWRNGISTEDYRRKYLVRLVEYHKRMQGVTVTNEDLIAVLCRIKNNRNAVVFLDVPYVPKLRGAKKVYKCEMSKNKHKKMLRILSNAKCKVILCGYRDADNDLYDSKLLHHGWKHYKVADLLKSCQSKSVKDYGEEWIWVNYELPYGARYVIDTSSCNWTAEERQLHSQQYWKDMENIKVGSQNKGVASC